MNETLVVRPSTAARVVRRRFGARPVVARPARVHAPRPMRESWPHSVVPSFGRDALNGLAQAQKAVPSTWLYDRRGSELFEAITDVAEYYPTRNEMQILRSCAREIAEAAGPRAIVIELGSGSSRKTRLLLGALDTPQAYLPIDISEQFLHESVADLPSLFAGLHVLPIVADFTRMAALPQLAVLRAGGADPGRHVVFFPGSTIGNFTPEAAVALLRRIRRLVGPDALLIVGADSTQDPAVLLPAYDDREGVTAEFNLNLLVRMNRELRADFDVDAFRHEARFDVQQQRVEMHLVSRRAQSVGVLGSRFEFRAGESIHTENSYKYSLLRLQQLAARAGWVHAQRWMDGQARFAIHVLEPIADARDQQVMFG
jgi:L-histidine N-alpha-methyltransferase